MDTLSLSKRWTLRLVCLVWITGLGMARLFPDSPLILGGVIFVSALIGVFPLRHTLSMRGMALLGLVFLLAITRSMLVPDPSLDPSRVESHTGQLITLKGTVGQISSPDGISSRFILDTSEPYSGPVYVISPVPLAITYGQVVNVTGVVERPLNFTADFSWEQYLESRGIRCVIRNPLVQPTGEYGKSAFLRGFDALRQNISDTIARLLPHRSGALLSGILMGSKASFSRSFLTDLQATGLTHIIALSGFNITILIAFVANILLRGSGRYARFVWSVATIAAFILLVGPSASVVRAASMGIITLLALTIGRRADPLGILLATLVAMTIYDPTWLFTDLGLQLSFLATLGIILFIPFIPHLLPQRPSWRILFEAIMTTLAAQATTFPLLLLNFGTISLVSPLSNLLVVSTVPSIMLLGSIAVLTGLIPGLGLLSHALAFLAYIPLAYVETVITTLSHLPLASVHITWWNGYWTMASYALIAGAYIALRRKLPMDKTAIH